MPSGAGGGGGGGGGGGRASAAAAAVDVVEIDLDDSDDDAGSGKSAAASESSSTISGNDGGGGGAAAIASSSSSSSSSSSNASGGGGAGKPEWVDVASLAASAAAPATAAAAAAGADDKPMGMSQLRAYIKSGRPSAANSGGGSDGGGAAAGPPTAEPAPRTRAALLTQWTSSRRVRCFVAQRNAYMMVDQPPNMRYQVPGVGPGLAAKIIADAPFRCADRNMGNVLQSIDGLGAKTAARIVAALDKGLRAARVAERQAQGAQAAQVRSAQAASQHQAAQVAQAAQAAQALAQAARSPALPSGKFHCLSCQCGAAEEQQHLFSSRHALSLHLRIAHRGANKLPAGVIYELPGAQSGAGGAGKRPAGSQEDAQASKRQHAGEFDRSCLALLAELQEM